MSPSLTGESAAWNCFLEGRKRRWSPRSLTPCRCNPACPALRLFPIPAPSFPAHSAVWLALFAAGLGPLGRRGCGCSAGPRRGALGSLQSPCVAESTAVSTRPAPGWLPIASHRLRHSIALWLAGRRGRSKQSRGLGISLAPLPPVPCPSADPRVSLFFLYSVLPAPHIMLPRLSF